MYIGVDSTLLDERLSFYLTTFYAIFTDCGVNVFGGRGGGGYEGKDPMYQHMYPIPL